MGISRRFISLFSGIGGLDLGLEHAGWQAAYASDVDPLAIESLVANVGYPLAGQSQRALERAFIERADVRTLQGKEILAKCGLRKGDAELLAGGPPCQSWSSAGHQLGFYDPRGRLFDDFVRIANDLDVRWILLENVRGLLTARGADGRPGSALDQIRRELLAAGFQTAVTLLNSADFGVPQRRVRLFMVGFRSGEHPPQFPVATHSSAPDLISTAPWVPLAAALEQVGVLSPKEVIRPSGNLAAELEGVGVGKGVRSPGKAERTRPGGHWGYKQGAFVADPSKSARTVTANSQQDWVKDRKLGLRRLCPRECAVIQGFPIDWQVRGSIAAQYRLIGNAVPPPVARAIGFSLAVHTEPAKGFAEEHHTVLLPLPERLAYHVRYTAREEASNGQSRRDGPARRVSRIQRSQEVVSLGDD